MDWTHTFGEHDIVSLRAHEPEPVELPPVSRADDAVRKQQEQARAQIERDRAAAQEAAAVLMDQLGLKTAAVQVQGNEHSIQVTVSRVAAAGVTKVG
jgi:hypothetical protein